MTFDDSAALKTVDISNGNPSVSDSAILPQITVTATDFELTHSRHNLSLADTVQSFQYGSELAGWTPIC